MDADLERWRCSDRTGNESVNKMATLSGEDTSDQTLNRRRRVRMEARSFLALPLSALRIKRLM